MVSNITKQLSGIELSLLFGIFLALIYDILRIFRKSAHLKKTAVFFIDVLFMAFASVVTFLLCLATNYGVIRFYHIGGEAIGMIIYFCTVGRITMFVFHKITKLMHIIYTKIVLKIINLLKRMYSNVNLKQKFQFKKRKIKKKVEKCR